MLWEHELQVSASTNILSSPKLSRVFLQLDRNMKNMFSISFRKYHDTKKKINLFTSIIEMQILSACAIITSTACASSVFLSSYRNRRTQRG